MHTVTKKMNIEKFENKLTVPEDVSVKCENGTLSLSKGKSTVTRVLNHRKVHIAVQDSNIVVSFADGTKREKTIAGTFCAHIKNMITGVTKGHKYELKICSGHFPMNVALSGNKFTINNFLGEKTPRVITIRDGADVKIEGNIVVVTGIDKELVAQTAASIEKLTNIKGKDLRIYQDGIYITNKDGKEIS